MSNPYPASQAKKSTKRIDPVKSIKRQIVAILTPERIVELAREIIAEGIHMPTKNAAAYLGIGRDTLMQSDIPRINVGFRRTRFSLKDLNKGGFPTPKSARRPRESHSRRTS